MSKLKAEFTSYISIALANDCIDYFCVQNRKNMLNESSIYDIEELEVSTSQYCDVGTFSFEEFNLNDIENRKLYFALETLTDNQKEILFLYSDGLTSREIGEYLGISAGTVRATVVQVKNKIRKYMEE